MSFEFHINGNQTTFFILFVLRSCTFGFADYIFYVSFIQCIEKNCNFVFGQNSNVLLNLSPNKEGRTHRT